MLPEIWQKELEKSIRSFDQLETFFSFTPSQELRDLLQTRRMSITPHTMKLIDFSDPNDPLLLMAFPNERELHITPEELLDPIGDDEKSPIPFLTHRYPDRVLIHVTFFCAQFCRFCFRRSKTGVGNPGPNPADIDRILSYLREHTEVEEVILTGGDPLTLSDQEISDWLGLLRGISSVRRIRIHTRVLVNLPSRITDSLIDIFRTFTDVQHPIYIVTHFNHPKEIAKENIDAVAKLVDAGIIVRNQHPLLRNINDNSQTLEELYKRLIDIRVVPYYIHQLDLAQGTNHFRVPLEKGMELMRSLQGKMTGIAIPRYMLDIPGGKGKVPMNPLFAKKIDENIWDIESPFGEQCSYVEPSTFSE